MSKELQSDFIFKVLLLGDSTVGKTCFLMRFTEGTYHKVHIATIGWDYRLKTLPLPDGKSAKVQIWDTAGQDRFRAITKNYYKGAHGIILWYDVTNVTTFHNVRNWVSQIQENASDRCVLYLIGNKIDDQEGRVVSFEQGQKWAEEFKWKFFETSAEANINIDDTFQSLIEGIYQNNKDQQNTGGQKLNIKTKKGILCCKSG